jgi:hypothetical protein
MSLMTNDFFNFFFSYFKNFFTISHLLQKLPLFKTIHNPCCKISFSHLKKHQFSTYFGKKNTKSTTNFLNKFRLLSATFTTESPFFSGPCNGHSFTGHMLSHNVCPERERFSHTDTQVHIYTD